MASRNYFIGKYCTVFVTQLNRDFKAESPDSYPESVLHYFTGQVESFDEDGIILKQLETGFRTWFSPAHVVGVAEEQKLEEDKPEDRQVIDQLKRQRPAPAPVPSLERPTGNVDINRLEKIVNLR